MSDLGDLEDARRWNQRYSEGTAGWDLGRAPPVVTRLARKLADRPRRVLVPGAGLGHDAIAWALAGHRATAVDFAPLAVQGARALARERGAAVDVLEADIFGMPDDLRGAFDLVWEQTCLCAIDPHRRGDYVAAMHAALEPGGELIALLWNHGRDGGPPWNMEPDEVAELMAPRFERTHIERVQGSNPDRVPEYLTRFTRRG